MSWWMILILVWLAPAFLVSLALGWSVLTARPRKNVVDLPTRPQTEAQVTEDFADAPVAPALEFEAA